MSSEQAKSYHSITIGNKNTWDDWYLIPTSRPLVNPPPLKTAKLEIAGGDGDLDLATTLTSKPTYGDRTGSWTFIVINDKQIPGVTRTNSWSDLYSEIMEYLHGKKHIIILDDEPSFSYRGRLAVSSWTSGKGNSSITISYRLSPYKTAVGNPGSKTF